MKNERSSSVVNTGSEELFEFIGRNILSFRWKRIVAMAVFTLNLAILIMNIKLGPLIATNIAASFFSIHLSIEMTTGTIGTTSFYIPTTFGFGTT
jgi:hypothetical protein